MPKALVTFFKCSAHQRLQRSAEVSDSVALAIFNRIISLAARRLLKGGQEIQVID
jgi:hypothetical protein